MEPKISEAIIKIADSFIHKYLDSSKTSRVDVVRIAVISWNLSFFNDEQKLRIYDNIEKDVPDTIDLVGFAGMMDFLERLAQEKNELYPNIRRMITKHEIRCNDDGGFELDITSIPFSKRS